MRRRRATMRSRRGFVRSCRWPASRGTRGARRRGFVRSWGSRGPASRHAFDTSSRASPRRPLSGAAPRNGCARRPYTRSWQARGPPRKRRQRAAQHRCGVAGAQAGERGQARVQRRRRRRRRRRRPARRRRGLRGTWRLPRRSRAARWSGRARWKRRCEQTPAPPAPPPLLLLPLPPPVLREAPAPRGAWDAYRRGTRRENGRERVGGRQPLTAQPTQVSALGADVASARASAAASEEARAEVGARAAARVAEAERHAARIQVCEKSTCQLYINGSGPRRPPGPDAV
jgi:hypothetical protein